MLKYLHEVAEAAGGAGKMHFLRRAVLQELESGAFLAALAAYVILLHNVVLPFEVICCMPSLGLDYESLLQINPGLIMVSISNFGHTGPYRDYAATTSKLIPYVY